MYGECSINMIKNCGLGINLILQYHQVEGNSQLSTVGHVQYKIFYTLGYTVQQQ